jgi:hypothetical protein
MDSLKISIKSKSYYNDNIKTRLLMDIESSMVSFLFLKPQEISLRYYELKSLSHRMKGKYRFYLIYYPMDVLPNYPKYINFHKKYEKIIISDTLYFSID